MDDYDNAEARAAVFEDRLAAIESGGGRGEGLSTEKRQGGRGGGGIVGATSNSNSNSNSKSKSRSKTSPSQQRAVDVSRALTRLLRHQATSAGVPLDAEGYAPLARVLAWGPLRRMGVTVAEVRTVVATNDKQRFALRADDDDDEGLAIRANQGHSIASVVGDQGLLTALTDAATAPFVVCHGTTFAAWPAIEAAGGLHRMNRNHVHFGCLDMAPPLPQDHPDTPSSVVIPGLRATAQIHVFVDVRRALRQDPDGLRWWRSANGVVLSEGDADGLVRTRWFSRVVITGAGARTLGSGAPHVLWQDGHKVADLPADAPTIMPTVVRGYRKHKTKTQVDKEST